MADLDTDESPPFTPFSDWITDHAQGDVDVDGKKGTVTLKVAVDTAVVRDGLDDLGEREGHLGSGGRTVEISCVVDAKAPTADPERSIFYVGDKGSLHRDDPYQRRLPLKRVSEPRLPNTTEE